MGWKVACIGVYWRCRGWAHLATGGVLQDQEERILGIDHLEQLDDVRVVELLHHLDLS